MKTRSLVPGLTLCVASAFYPVFCQTSLPDQLSKEQLSDAPMYQHFFQEIALFKNLTNPALMNGANTNVTLPLAKSILKVTDAELQNLIAWAEECLAKVTPIEQEMRKPLFEARLEAIRTGATPADLHDQIQQLESFRDHLVLDCVQQIKHSFGPLRFGEMDRVIRSNKDKPSFLSSAPATINSSTANPK